MSILLLNLTFALTMLAPTKKPYNPNYDQSTAADKNWNKTDLISFLDNIHNVPINDITPSGKDISFFQTATQAETTAELIRTINFTHYKLLSGVKDVINYNNLLLNKIQKRNNSFGLYEKKLKQLTVQTQRNSYFLLQLKMAHSWPDAPTDGSKNDTCQVTEPRIDINNDESIHPIINASPITTTANLPEPQLKQNIIESQTVSPIKDIISEVSSDHHNALDNIQSKCTPQASVILHDTNNLPINDGPSQQNNPSIQNNLHSIESTDIKTELSIDTNIPKPIEPINDGSFEQHHPSIISQNICTSSNSCANKRGQINLINQPQTKSQNLLDSSTYMSTSIDENTNINIPSIASVSSLNKINIKSPIIINKPSPIKPLCEKRKYSNKPQIKCKTIKTKQKKKKKKIKNNSNNKQKNKNKKQQNNKKKSTIIKKNKNNLNNNKKHLIVIKNEEKENHYQSNKFKNDEIENYIINYKFNNDQYDDWTDYKKNIKNISAKEYYELSKGKITNELIQEWLDSYHP